MTPPDDFRADLTAGAGCGVLILMAVGASTLFGAIAAFIERAL